MKLPRFSDLHDIGDCARALGVSATRIETYADAADQSAYYTALKIAKRGASRAGQFRTVFKARHEWISQLHRGVQMMVAANTSFGEHVQGFMLKRSIRTNAQQHLGARQVLHGDVRAFFDAITTEQVERGFISLGTPAAMAAVLARACTIDGRLRQGTRCSPPLANLVCRQLDVDFLALAQAHGCVYTRYADDLVFSGDKTPDSASVQNVLAQHGFELRDDRCVLQKRGRTQFVTGLHVGDPAQARLPRRLKRRLRLVLHYVERFGTDGHFHRPGKTCAPGNALALAGLLRYMQSIEPALAKKLREQYGEGSFKSFAARNGIPLP